MLELPPPQVDRLAKLIPEGMSLAQALQSVPELRKARRNPDALPIERSCPCPTALRDAIITQPDNIPAETRQRLDLLVGKYLT